MPRCCSMLPPAPVLTANACVLVPPACPVLPCPAADVPVLRHYSYTNKFYGAVKGWQLTIRMVAEVYNYDYIIDTHLYVDGTFETRVQTSG